jgi:hypothetical protein
LRSLSPFEPSARSEWRQGSFASRLSLGSRPWQSESPSTQGLDDSLGAGLPDDDAARAGVGRTGLGAYGPSVTRGVARLVGRQPASPLAGPASSETRLSPRAGRTRRRVELGECIGARRKGRSRDWRIPRSASAEGLLCRRRVRVVEVALSLPPVVGLAVPRKIPAVRLVRTLGGVQSVFTRSNKRSGGWEQRLTRARADPRPPPGWSSLRSDRDSRTRKKRHVYDHRPQV